VSIATRPASPTADAPLASRWWVLAVLSLAQVLVMLDVSIINTAIPAIAREFEASSATLQWLVDSYALLFAGLLLLAGALGDRYGRRRILALGLAVFAAGSVGAALSTTTTVLIVLRAVQGVGAALVIPQTLSILTAVFPREERSKAIGLWTGALGLGTAGGPLLGGALVDTINWAAVFWVPAPIALAALIGLRIVPESRSEGGDRRLDLTGAVLGTVGISALVYGVIEGHGAGWTSAEIIAAFGVALPSFSSSAAPPTPWSPSSSSASATSTAASSSSSSSSSPSWVSCSSSASTSSSCRARARLPRVSICCPPPSP
jgi:MFS family permease